MGVGDPLNVTPDVSVDPTYGFPLGCASFATVGLLDNTGVPAGDAVDAGDSPFMLRAFTVNV